MEVVPRWKQGRCMRVCGGALFLVRGACAFLCLCMCAGQGCEQGCTREATSQAVHTHTHTPSPLCAAHVYMRTTLLSVPAVLHPAPSPVHVCVPLGPGSGVPAPPQPSCRALWSRGWRGPTWTSQARPWPARRGGTSLRGARGSGCASWPTSCRGSPRGRPRPKVQGAMCVCVCVCVSMCAWVRVCVLGCVWTRLVRRCVRCACV